MHEKVRKKTFFKYNLYEMNDLYVRGFRMDVHFEHSPNRKCAF